MNSSRVGGNQARTTLSWTPRCQRSEAWGSTSPSQPSRSRSSPPPPLGPTVAGGATTVEHRTPCLKSTCPRTWRCHFTPSLPGDKPALPVTAQIPPDPRQGSPLSHRCRGLLVTRRCCFFPELSRGHVWEPLPRYPSHGLSWAPHYGESRHSLAPTNTILLS